MAIDPLDDAPPPEELEMATEELIGHPLKGNPAERIEALRQRIAYLEEQHRCSSKCDEPMRSLLLHACDRDLAEARQQLREWTTQFEGRN